MNKMVFKHMLRFIGFSSLSRANLSNISSKRKTLKYPEYILLTATSFDR